jgi:hypothetical protein
MHTQLPLTENAAAINLPEPAAIAPLDPPDRHIDKLLDQALADSFPASDPVSTLAVDPT